MNFNIIVGFIIDILTNCSLAMINARKLSAHPETSPTGIGLRENKNKTNKCVHRIASRPQTGHGRGACDTPRYSAMIPRCSRDTPAILPRCSAMIPRCSRDTPAMLRDDPAMLPRRSQGRSCGKSGARGTIRQEGPMPAMLPQIGMQLSYYCRISFNCVESMPVPSKSSELTTSIARIEPSNGNFSGMRLK